AWRGIARTFPGAPRRHLLRPFPRWPPRQHGGMRRIDGAAEPHASAIPSRPHLSPADAGAHAHQRILHRGTAGSRRVGESFGLVEGAAESLRTELPQPSRMILEVLNTGSELLLGKILNTHVRFLAERLFPLGLRISRQVAVPDAEPIREAIAE